MRIIRASELRWVPWKNRGGLAADVAVSPPGADWHDFDWRVSFARVEREGDFSIFPGVERTMVLLAGAGLDLIGADGSTRRVETGGPSVVFPGDLAVVGRPLFGPIDNLNVMVRRGRFTADVDRVAAGGSVAPPADAVATLIVVEHGSFAHPGAPLLDPRDALVAEGPQAIEAGAATLIAVSIRLQSP